MAAWKPARGSWQLGALLFSIYAFITLCAGEEEGPILNVSETSAPVRGLVKSCPACRLNVLPQVREFLKGQHGIRLYENVEISWIRGHNPDLYLLNEKDEEIEKIDLSPYSFEELHELLQSKGFRQREGSLDDVEQSVVAAQNAYHPLSLAVLLLSVFGVAALAGVIYTVRENSARQQRYRRLDQDSPL